MPAYVIGHLDVLLGCHACGAVQPVQVPVTWDGASAKPQLDDGADLHLWHEAHQQPYALAP